MDIYVIGNGSRVPDLLAFDLGAFPLPLRYSGLLTQIVAEDMPMRDVLEERNYLQRRGWFFAGQILEEDIGRLGEIAAQIEEGGDVVVNSLALFKTMERVLALCPWHPPGTIAFGQETTLQPEPPIILTEAAKEAWAF